MKNRLSVWVAAAAAAALGCASLSAGPTPDVSTTSNSVPPPRRAPSAAPASGPAATTAVVGTLAQVGGGRLTIRSPDDRNAVLDLTDATRVTIDGRPATIGDLQPGMAVRASCDSAWHVLALDASHGDAAGSAGSVAPRP
jgi:hypothetical protein